MRPPREEGCAPDPHRLQNSGPTTREVYRTAAIGSLLHFDFDVALGAWDRPGGVVRTLEESAEAGDGIPATIVTCVTGAVLRELGVDFPVAAERDRDGQARRALALLVDTLRARSMLDDLVGIALHEHRTATTPTRAAGSVSSEELARTLAVLAVYTPPLVLWTRTPSLRWICHDTLIVLRRFDLPGATGGGQ
jgi:hypothetical protein